MSLLFESFDRLLLLQRGGETVRISPEIVAWDLTLILRYCAGLLR